MTPESPAGRDSNGRFTKGNKFGPGNPFARKVAGLRAALLRKMDDAHMEQIADKLLELALAGDLAAIKLVLLYAIGRPADAVNPDDLERLEFEQHRANSAPMDQVQELITDLMPLDVANKCLRGALPASSDAFAQQALAALHAVDEPAPPAEPKEPEPVAHAPVADAAPHVLPIGRPTVTKREQRPARAANRGQPRPAAPSTNGGNGRAPEGRDAPPD